MSKVYDLKPSCPDAFGGVRHAAAGLSLSEKEEKLIHLIREMQFGQIQLHIADGQPVRLEEIRKSVKL